MATLCMSFGYKPLALIKTLKLIHPHTPISLPISPPPKISISLSLNRNNLTAECKRPTFLKTAREGAAVLLLGTLFFFGICGRRRLAPSLAEPLKSSVSENLEVKIDEPKKEEGEGEDELCARLLERDPADVNALKMTLYAKMKKGKRAEAVKYLERLVALEPDEVEWRLLQALMYELMGQIGKAKKLFKMILKERPLLLRALHGLALAMYKNKEGPAAFDMLYKALDLAYREKRVTEERNIKILIAQMHVVKGDMEGALKQFEVLINEDPRDFRPHLCQGIIYSILDKKKEADDKFEIYQSLIPDEFQQRGFIDDVILAAKTESQEHLKKDLQ